MALTKGKLLIVQEVVQRNQIDKVKVTTFDQNI